MLDIILAQYVMPSNSESAQKRTGGEELATMLILLLILVAALSAIITACRRKDISDSFSGDIVLATFSPIMYWILFAFRCVSHGRVPA